MPAPKPRRSMLAGLNRVLNEFCMKLVGKLTEEKLRLSLVTTCAEAAASSGNRLRCVGKACGDRLKHDLTNH